MAGLPPIRREVIVGADPDLAVALKGDIKQSLDKFKSVFA